MKRKGFTLVELLVTIILLGIVGGIIIYNMTSVSDSSKETEYERFVAKVKSAATVYADLNPEAFDELYVSKAYKYITVEDLIQDGLIDEDLVNPYTDEKIGKAEKIKANLDSTSGALTFTYPIEKQEEETFLVAISDYVVYGEPYNCMTGAGTYRLALAGEDGELIQLTNSDGSLNGATIEKYNFECSFDKDGDFQKYNDSIEAKKDGKVVSTFDYMYTTTPGTYEITYNWITESGTKKKATRKLVVNAKIQPELEFTSTDGTTVADNTMYRPNAKDNTSWNYLTFKPTVTGADLNKTTYTIRVGNKSDNLRDFVVDGVAIKNSNDYNSSYVAFDGEYYYEISTNVKGHYYENYSYDSLNKQKITQDLVSYDWLVSNRTTNWEAQKTYLVEPTYSVIGIDHYEYTLAESEKDAPVNGTNGTYPKATYDSATKKFKLSASAINANACANGKDVKSYKYIYIRAVNKDGYKGSQWIKFDGYLSNNLFDLIKTNSNSCQPKGNLPQEAIGIINNSSNLNGLECAYREKIDYIDWGTEEFVVLGKYKSSDSKKGMLLVATDGAIDIDSAPGVTSASQISMTQIKYKKWWIQTCDGLYSAAFKYVTPAFDNLKTAVNQYYNNKLNAIANRNKASVYNTTWSAKIGQIDFNKMPNTAAYFSDTSSYYTRYSQWQYDPSAAGQWSEWAKAFQVSDVKYESNVGTPNYDDYKVFGNALSSITRGNKNYPYWLATTFQSAPQTARVAHGDTLTYSDTHFYAIDTKVKPGDAYTGYTANKNNTNSVVSYQKQCYSIKVNGKNGCENLPYVYAYAGSKAYVKGMMKITGLPVISVSNSNGKNIYKVSTCA